MEQQVMPYNQLETDGYKVYENLIPGDVVDSINNKTHLLEAHRAHGINHKYYPRPIVKECEQLGIWWSQQLTDWPEIQLISNILINTVGSIFKNPSMYVADIITNEPGNTFIKPHIDTPYRFDQWHDSTEILGIQCIVPLCKFTTSNGGTGLLPGSHTKNWIVRDSYAGKYNEEFLEGVVQPEMNVGDVLAYHPKTLHSTMPNTTDMLRRALLIHITDYSMIAPLKLVDNIWVE